MQRGTKDDNYAYCDIANIGNINEYITVSGKEIEQWDNVVFEYNSEEGNILTDYLANLYRWFVVAKIKDARIAYGALKQLC